MKKTYTLLLLFFVSLGALFAQSASDNWQKLSKNRIDYFDSNGERLHSAYPFSNYYIIYFRPYFEGNNYDTPAGYIPIDPDVPLTSSVKMVPNGEYSYPLAVTCEEDINVTVTTASSSGVISRANKETEVRSGDDVTFYIDLPEGVYPQATLTHEYTENKEEKVPLWTEEYSFYLFQNIEFLYGGEYYDSVVKRLSSEGGEFEKDPEKPGRWKLNITMPNEPLSINFSYISPDVNLLNQLISNASQMLYQGCPLTISQIPTFFCGDPWASVGYGECMSCDDISTRNCTAGHYFSNLTILQPNYILSSNTWAYYLGVVAGANYYMEMASENLKNICSADEMRTAEAVFRTIRAYAYYRMLQIFGPRWQDSNNGSMPVAPIYTDWKNPEQPLSTFNQIRDFIREDLAFAKENLPEAEEERKIIPHKSVAHGIAARLALLCQDWITAEEESRYLLDRYPLTTNENLTNGFCESNPAWIWTADCPVSLLGYFSYQSSAAINGAYTLLWNVGSVVGCIDRQLFLSIPEKDMRRSMYIMPETIGNRFLTSDFYNSNYIEHADMSLFLDTSIRYEAEKLMDGYKPSFVEGYNSSGEPQRLFFGNQMKFWGHETEIYNDKDEVCFMRTEEFLLTRAEALYHLGRENEAMQLLMNLNIIRNPEYSSDATGSALLDEIRLYRRIELWGEGHSFFDFKRWKLPLIRKPWVEGDETSGNWPSDFVSDEEEKYVAPTAVNGWRAMIPVSIVKNNSKIDITSLGYDDISFYEEAMKAPCKQLEDATPSFLQHNSFKLENMPFTKLQKPSTAISYRL